MEKKYGNLKATEWQMMESKWQLDGTTKLNKTMEMATKRNT